MYIVGVGNRVKSNTKTTRQVDHKSSMVAIRALLTVAGDREVESYKRDDARALLAYLQSVGNKTATIRRRFNTISAILNFAYQELEIDRRNPFAKMTIAGEGWMQPREARSRSKSFVTAMSNQ